jgi:hypothetical protein
VFFQKKRAQSISEYVILITIVVVVVISMFTYVKRGTQGLIRATADQIGSQEGSEQNFNGLGGYMTGSNTVTSSYSEYNTMVWPGAVQKVFSEGSDTQSNTASNLGFTEIEK